MAYPQVATQEFTLNEAVMLKVLIPYVLWALLEFDRHLVVFFAHLEVDWLSSDMIDEPIFTKAS